MSDFVSHDILPDLWEEILQRHWTFLETEESIQKLEERKKLEGCLKEFLCIVPHDRKFFLPETGHVLRKSIREMDDFTAYKALVGFEAISQYANNLFTKPWRKEYRVLKTYSGFYHHEVKLNLLDADKMLEAMGYRRVSNEVLVLDGPICPDQVTNVSRDAMAAYVECQIIKHIYSELLKLGVNCSWQDVYHYRETHVGGTSQAIKALAYSIQERRLRKEKPYNSSDACYPAAQQLQQQCSNCGPYHQRPQNQQMSHKQQPMQGACAIHGNNMYPVVSSNFGNKLTASYPTSNNYMPPGCTQQHPQMTHSRSLEHYNEPHAMLPHRHSFDHQQQGCTAHHYQQLQPMPQHLYESPYDCIDGTSLGSTASYSMVADATTNNCSNTNPNYVHPYNVSGNRVPLPYNISNQLNTPHFAPQNVTCNGISGTSDGGYANIVENTNNYATIAKKNNCNVHGQMGISSLPGARQLFNAKDIQNIKQRPLPPEQLIDFDDKAGLLGHDYNAHHYHTSSSAYDYERERMYDGRGDMGGSSANVPIYSQPILNTDRQMPAPSQTIISGSGNYEYARPVPRSSRIKPTSNMNPQAQMMPGANMMPDKRFRSKEVSQDFDNNLQLQTELNTAINNLTLHPSTSRRKVSAHTIERDTSDHTSYDSENGTAYQRTNQLQRSPTQAVKNQDGVGSYESWNYVFQNLERSGYTKDLGEREDLLVQGLDVRGKGANSTNATATTTTELDKRRDVKSTTKSVDKLQSNQERVTASTTANAASTGATKKIVKSALKTPKITSSTPAPTSSTTIYSDNKFANNNVTTSKSNSINNNVSNSSTNPQSNGVRKSSQQKVPPPVSTQVIVTGPNEWSCQYCTFLNPNSKRVCEMCCRSKDFQLDAVVISHAPTCV